MQLTKNELKMIRGALRHFIRHGKEILIDEDFSHYEELLKKIIKKIGKEG